MQGRLSNLLSSEFESPVRFKGLQYFQENRVELVQISAGFAEFEVQGHRRYKVKIHVSQKQRGPAYEFDCTCPYFEDYLECKHVWAAILQIDHDQLLAKIQNSSHAQALLPRQGEFPGLSAAPTAAAPEWHERIQSIRKKLDRDRYYGSEKSSTNAKGQNPRVGSYAIDIQSSSERGQIQIQLMMQEILKKGGLGILKSAELNHERIECYEDPLERDFLWDLIGRTEVIANSYGYSSPYSKISSLALTSGHADPILRKISDSQKLFRLKEKANRYYGRYDRPELMPYVYETESWNFQLLLKKLEENFQLEGQLVSNLQQTRTLQEVKGCLEHFVFFENTLARSDVSLHQVWFELLKNKPIQIPPAELEPFLDYLWNQSAAKVPIELPSEVQLIENSDILPTPQISFEASKNSGRFAAQMLFDYAGIQVEMNSGRFIYNIAAREKTIRNLDFENSCYQQFLLLNPLPSEDSHIQGYFSVEQFLPTVEKVMALGWPVFAKNQKMKMGSDFQINMTSGLDWFDLKAQIQFDQQVLHLPQLLHALKTGQRMITLDDGSIGLLPAEWLKKFAPFIGVAKATEEGLRLSKVQALFLSSSLEENEFFKIDKKVHNLRKIITDLQQLAEQNPDKKLVGKLRGYQKTGLAWLSTLAKNQIGGILADDMGLGKTIQVLALLCDDAHESKISKQQNHLPSLVLAPKSLVFNWKNEASKFTPHLKVLTYAGQNRGALISQIPEHDLVVATYQTLRNDIELFQKQKFNFLILDEAHNLKNSKSQITMAAKLLSSEKKIALTGTPVENSLMDLFSILSVVTPGLVSDVQAQRWVKESSTESIQRLSRALRPFILRRTKEQVLKDLPEKSEQILYCELSDSERKKYNELKSFYWSQLSGKIESKGLAKSKIEVLEALLRLRQAACHQGLLDDKFMHAQSAKFDLVLEQLDNVIKDGHKALIFSQFTSLLELFARQLKAKKLNFEYLDGKTNDRAERVENFQNNDQCQLFLLSLKAGGVGLNLTAADYVFILDPWWNPAAESQAIDRTHRIGQTKKVFAYKIIAKDTVEEKILALQQKKKTLAKAIISEEASLLKNLKIQDLQELFL